MGLTKYGSRLVKSQRLHGENLWVTSFAKDENSEWWEATILRIPFSEIEWDVYVENGVVTYSNKELIGFFTPTSLAMDIQNYKTYGAIVDEVGEDNFPIETVVLFKTPYVMERWGVRSRVKDGKHIVSPEDTLGIGFKPREFVFTLEEDADKLEKERKTSFDAREEEE